MSAPPGWYPDPVAPQSVRWWDGVQWSPHTAPAYGPDPVRDLAGETRAGRHARIALIVAPALWLADYLIVALVFRDVWHRVHHNFELLQNGQHANSFSALQLRDSLLIDLIALVLLPTQILFIIWFYKAAELGRRAGIPARHSPGWTIAGFVIPVVNFWFPYQSAADLFPPGHPQRRTAGRWWLWYLVQGWVTIPLMVAGYFSKPVAVGLALVFIVVPVLAAQSGRQLITAANAAHAQLAQPR